MSYVDIGQLKARYPLMVSKGHVDEDTIAKAERQYPVFVAHSFHDRHAAWAIKQFIREFGEMEAYVDWIDDPLLDRTQVSPETAEVLRRRIGEASIVLLASSPLTRESRWVPWEIGYADGAGKKVGILPILDFRDQQWSGTEFFGLYPEFNLFVNANDKVLLGAPSRHPSFKVLLENWAKA